MKDGQIFTQKEKLKSKTENTL